MNTRARGLRYAVLSLLCGGAAYGVAVCSRIGQQAEARVLQAAVFEENPPAPLSVISQTSVLIALLLIALLALWAHGIGRVVAILVSAATALGVSQLLKYSVLDRPQFFDAVTANSFPSGHMTVFAVLAGGLLWAVRGVLRAGVAVCLSLLLAVVSWQLLEFGWHRPSDVLGAQALAVCAFALAALIRPGRSRRARTSPTLPSAAVTRIVIFGHTLTAIAFLLGAAVVLVRALLSRDDALMLLAGQLSLIGSSVFTVRTFVKLCPS